MRSLASHDDSQELQLGGRHLSAVRVGLAMIPAGDSACIGEMLESPSCVLPPRGGSALSVGPARGPAREPTLLFLRIQSCEREFEENRARVFSRARSGKPAPRAVNDLNRLPICAARAAFVEARHARASGPAPSHAPSGHSFSLRPCAVSPVAVIPPALLLALLRSAPPVQRQASSGGHAARVASEPAPAARGNHPA